MHPAYSVILFTTASGAGYGLLVWLGFGRLLRLLPPAATFAWPAFRLAPRVISRRPLLLARAPWPARAGLARIVAMALVLAIARGRDGACDLCAGRPVGVELAVV